MYLGPRLRRKVLHGIHDGSEETSSTPSFEVILTKITSRENGCYKIYGLFVFNTNLTFLYNIDIDGFKKKKKLPPVGFELTTATITKLEF